MSTNLIISSGVGAYGTDTNDCTVRALANATGMKYSDAFRLFKDVGRKDTKGASTDICTDIFNRYGKLRAIYGSTNTAKYLAWKFPKTLHVQGTTLKTLLQKLPKGIFIVMLNDHVLCVQDHKIVDLFHNNGNKRVAAVWEFSA